MRKILQKTIISGTFLGIFILFVLVSCTSKSVSLENALLELEEGTYTQLEARKPFNSIYEIHFQQPLDHHNPEAGYFTQKVYISHIDSIRPVVFITEGYTANRAYQSEISRLLDAN